MFSTGPETSLQICRNPFSSITHITTPSTDYAMMQMWFPIIIQAYCFIYAEYREPINRGYIFSLYCHHPVNVMPEGIIKGQDWLT